MEGLTYRSMLNTITIAYNAETEHVLVEKDSKLIAKFPVEYVFDFLYKSLLGNTTNNPLVARRRGQLRMGILDNNVNYNELVKSEMEIPAIKFPYTWKDKEEG